MWGRGDQTTRGSGDQGYANQSHWHNELLHPWGPDSLQFSTGNPANPNPNPNPNSHPNPNPNPNAIQAAVGVCRVLDHRRAGITDIEALLGAGGGPAVGAVVLGCASLVAVL